ncbi:heavy metal-associated isoprenylated plant protein 3-like [Euphorbia lathyris]|uniref:heavy metal-associated isoprenylated plant protein 3-like n=1 Tax=Euphorbia lathyris TaxID=212925 RepID=UPI0033137053
MGKKKNNNNPQQQHEDSNEEDKEVEKKKEGGEGGDKKKEGKNNNGSSVVLKIEMHCDGCASKVSKLARSFQGVESVKVDSESNKLTVVGKVDPSQIRDFLHQKTKKKVELISPQPKKEDSNNDKNKKKDDNKKSDDKKPDADNKKPKEAPVTTAVIKVAFHCSGCIEKIHKIVSKTKGVHDVAIDKQKETVTVKGTMDVKALTENLKERLKRPVEIVPPKKEKDGGSGGGGGGDGEKSGSGEGGKKKKKGGGEGQENAGGGGGEVASAKMEGNRMEYMMQPGFGYGYGAGPGYGYMGQPMTPYGNGYVAQPVPVYGNGYMGMGPAPPVPVYDYGYGYGHGHVPGYPVHMKFNDENPNACSVM